MSEPLDTVMQARQEVMVSPTGDSNPTLRTAHFLQPSVSSINGPVAEIPSLSPSSLPPTFEPGKWPLKIQFKGWRRSKKWAEWVDKMHSKHESVWRKVGIFEAIVSTAKVDIIRDEHLIFGIAERFCIKTNTFLFPWGEATITLEDVMVLGGYPVLGSFAFSPLETEELKDIEGKMLRARTESGRSKWTKASIRAWITLFMNSGKDIEHEAFLAAWLSMYVFPYNCLVRQLVFPIAIRLARGNPIALAPAVLASIYRDLTLLKQTIVDLANNPVNADEEHLELVLRSPFYLVQLWVWERIGTLQPKPRMINYDDPVMARWHRVTPLKIGNVRLALDVAGEDFLWRPYARFTGNRHSPVFYANQGNGMWIQLGSSLNEELKSLVICLRVSELVGPDTIKQYLPHRVAMQFGMDQDLPGCVPSLKNSPEIAWGNYCRPIIDGRLFITSRLFEADVTTRYAEWWKSLSVLPLGYKDPVKNIVQGKRSPRKSNQCSKPRALNDGIDADVTPGFLPKRSNAVAFGNPCEDGLDGKRGGNCIDVDMPPAFLMKRVKAVTSGSYVGECSRAKEGDNNVDVPPGFPPKHDNLISGNYVKECKPKILEEIEHGGNGMSHSLDKVTAGSCKHLSNQAQSSSASADYEVVTNVDSLVKLVADIKSEPSTVALEEVMEDANATKNMGTPSYDRITPQLMKLEDRVSMLERAVAELKNVRFGHSNRS